MAYRVLATLFFLLIFLNSQISFAASIVLTLNGGDFTVSTDNSGDPSIDIEARFGTLTIDSGVTVSATNDTTNEEGHGGVVLGEVSQGVPWDTFSLEELVNNGTISGSTPTTGLGVHVCADSWGLEIATITTLTNNGVITGQYGIQVREKESTINTLDNSSTGVISGDDTAIRILGGAIDEINNSGTITGSNNCGIHILTSSENVVSPGTLTNTIMNSGSITGNIAIYLENGSTIGAINNSGTITGTGGTAIDLDNAANALTITNTGAINGHIDLGINDLNIDGAAPVITGTVAGTGAVTVNGGFTSDATFSVGTFTIANGGTFDMEHDVTSAGSFNNEGVLAAAAGDAVTGNYVQTSNGTLEIEIGGLVQEIDYDVLQVTNGGTATLAGTLEVLLTNGYKPASGESFDILTASSVTGEFETFVFPAMNGVAFEIEYGADYVRLTTVPDGDSDTDRSSSSGGGCFIRAILE